MEYLSKVFKSTYYALIISFILLDTAKAQPQVIIQSPEVTVESNKVNKPTQNNTQTQGDGLFDLRRFFEMDNPKEAAKKLKEYVQKQGISYDEPHIRRQKVSNVTSKKNKPSNLKTLIHVFNGKEFSPETGINKDLSEKVNRLFKVSKTEEQLVCILQIEDNMTIGNVIEVLEAGVKVYEPVGERAQIVRLPISAINKLKQQNYVRWIGEYLPEYKYYSASSYSRKKGAFIYTLGGDRSEYRRDLESMGINISWFNKTVNCYGVTLDENNFPVVTQLWWVKGIQKEPEEVMESTVTVNFNPYDSRRLISADKTNYSGNGITIGVRDSGLFEGHTELIGRIDLENSELDHITFHGTHVTGIIAGRPKPIQGYWNNDEIKGVAPDAMILFRETDPIDNYFDFINAYLYDLNIFKNNNVQISNHSYFVRSIPFNEKFDYDGDTKNFDKYCDDEDFIIVKSAGNEKSSGITNPGTGKNVLAVGAICYVKDSENFEKFGDHAFLYSSKGPTEDGRLKPELVAPGGGIDQVKNGVVSTNSNPWEVRKKDGSIDRQGSINGVHEKGEWESDDYYNRMSGTSMAAPHVTGVLAKMKEWSPNLHSEVMKALLINTTIPIKANSDDPLSAYANTEVGYGLVNAFSITDDYTGESDRLLFAEGLVTQDDTAEEWSITVPSGVQKLVVTMAYNDEEGETSDDYALKDDLDLILISPNGPEYRVSIFKALDVKTDSPIEKTVITNPPEGNWTVRINFEDSPGFNNPLIYAVQRYGVVAHAIFKEPALNLSIQETTFDVVTNEIFTVQPTITNTGGYIAVGTTIEIKDKPGDGFSGDIKKNRYVGNLMYQNATISPVFNIQAPSTSGTYTLTIEADGINKEFDNPQETQITVNVESFSDEADIALIIDSSGSMGNNDPNNLRISASKFFIDLANEGTQLTIIDFDGGVKVLAPLTLIDSDSAREALKQAVDKVDASGQTDLGLGLQTGYYELNKSQNPDTPKAAVFLTDGDGYYSDQAQLYINKGWTIYTLGLGSDVNQLLLTQIAKSTPGGEYFPVSLDNIQTVYNKIITRISGNSIVYTYNGYINPQQSINLPSFSVASSVKELTVSGNIQGSSLELILTDPNGKIYDPLTTDPNVKYTESETFVFYKIRHPVSGDWDAQVTGIDINSGGESFNISMTTDSVISSNMLPFETSYNVGDTVRIGVILKEEISKNNWVPLTGTTVVAEIINPNGNINIIQLFDDGAHDDDAAGDGIFANTYSQLNQIGNYLIKVETSNERVNNVHETFHVGALDQVSVDGSGFLPEPYSITKTYRPTVQVLLMGNGQKIDAQSIELNIDGIQVPHVFDSTNLSVTYLPTYDLVIGEHRAGLRLKDVYGNEVPPVEWIFNVMNITLYVSTTGDDLLGKGRKDYPYCTIQKAINKSADGDTIIVADGIYNGHGNVNLGFHGKNIYLRSENGPENCIIDSEHKNRGFFLYEKETSQAIIEGFTIRNGMSDQGAGICCCHSSPTIINNIIINNISESYGGGIYCDYSSPMILNNIIENNTSFLGGGVYGENCSFTLSNNMITGNTAKNSGGGIFCNNSQPTINNNNINWNFANTLGGGIYFSQTSANLINNLLFKNKANQGAGVYITSSSPSFINCTIADNSAREHGGAFYCINGSSIVITNSILWLNSPEEIYSNEFGDFNSITLLYSDIEGELTKLITNDNCVIEWLEGNISLNPKFADPTNSNYHLFDSSPCIGAGSKSHAPLGDIEGTNRGLYPDIGVFENILDKPLNMLIKGYVKNNNSLKPISGAQVILYSSNSSDSGISTYTDSSGYFEIINISQGEYYLEIKKMRHEKKRDPETDYFNIKDGEIENRGTILLVPMANFVLHINCLTGDDLKGDGTQENPFSTIKKGIMEAYDGETILVADGVYKGSNNVNLEFFGKAIILKSGNGPETCIIDCDNIEITRCFYFHENETSNTIVDGFTIRNGNTDYGGGIFCSSSSPQIMNCRIISNYVSWSGGGIYCQHGSSPMIINTVFSKNHADNVGGAMYLHSSYPILRNTTISDNLAGYHGGGIACFSSSIEIVNSILWNNNPEEINFMRSPNSNSVNISYSNLEDGDEGIVTNNIDKVLWGKGNINVDPLFVSPKDLNYHLLDISPCIDAGDPLSNCSNEPEPNGGRINIGTYGNTPEATKSVPNIQITTPNGGEKLIAGESFDINWHCTGDIGTIDIEYSIDGGNKWEPIIQNYESSLKTYTWLVANVLSETCGIRITKSSDSTVTDQNKEFFSIIDNGIWGDVNNDGLINILDALIIATYEINPNSNTITKFIPYIMRRGDVNGKGTITGTDAMIIAKYYLNPQNPNLGNRIGKRLEFAPKITTQKNVEISSFAIPYGIVKNSENDEFIIESFIKSSNTFDHIGFAVVKIKWNPQNLQLCSINEELDHTVINNEIVNEGSIIFSRIDVSRAKPFVLPPIRMRCLNHSFDEINIEILNAASSDTFNEYSLEKGITTINTPQNKPKNYSLYQNFPNPFNPQTTIKYKVVDHTYVKLYIFNIYGQKIKTLVKRYQHPGFYSVVWNGTDDSENHASSGVYIYEIRMSNFKDHKQMLLLR